MTANEVLTVIAIFAGPVTALFVQREIDRRRENTRRRIDVFRIIWATRMLPQRLHLRHVEAINMVGIDFKDCHAVVDAWKEYLDMLLSPDPQPEAQKQAFYEDRDSKFHSLVYEISKVLGYDFSRLDIKKQCYSPQLHGTTLEQELVTRAGLAKLFSGEVALPVRIVADPPTKA